MPDSQRCPERAATPVNHALSLAAGITAPGDALAARIAALAAVWDEAYAAGHASALTGEAGPRLRLIPGGHSAQREESPAATAGRPQDQHHGIRGLLCAGLIAVAVLGGSGAAYALTAGHPGAPVPAGRRAPLPHPRRPALARALPAVPGPRTGACGP